MMGLHFWAGDITWEFLFTFHIGGCHWWGSFICWFRSSDAHQQTFFFRYLDSEMRLFLLSNIPFVRFFQ